MGSPGRGKAFAAARPEGAPAPAWGPGFVHDVQHAREIRVRPGGEFGTGEQASHRDLRGEQEPAKGRAGHQRREGRHAQAMDVAAGRMMSLEVATQPGKDHKAGAQWECKAPN